MHNAHFTDGQTEAQHEEVAEIKPGPSGYSVCTTPPHSPGRQPAHLRLEVLVDEDVIAVQLKAVLVADDRLLHALQAPDEDVVHVAEQRLHRLGPVLGREVLTEALQHPLAALGPRAPSVRWKREPQLTGTRPAGTPNNHCMALGLGQEGPRSEAGD